MSISGSNEATQSVPFGGAPAVITLTGASAAGSASTPSRSDHSHGFNPPACRVYSNANQSLTNNTLTALTFNSERYDTDTMHSTSSNTSRITFTTAGVYAITGHVAFAPDTDYTALFLGVRLNGTTFIAIQEHLSAVSGAPRMSISTAHIFAAADYVELVARHINTSAGANNVEVQADFSPEFSATWVGVG